MQKPIVKCTNRYSNLHRATLSQNFGFRGGLALMHKKNVSSILITSKKTFITLLTALHTRLQLKRDNK